MTFAAEGRATDGETRYVFDNAAGEARTRFASLAALYDPGTIRHLEARGTGAGWRCLEVGGGDGSIAVWLSARVGPRGRVVVTDIDTRYLETLRRPNLAVRRHDIAADELEAGAFDLVHTRLVLAHLPARDRALRRMLAALKPGGWAVVEEFDAAWLGTQVLPAQAAMQRVMAARGVDLGLGRRLPGLLQEAGLAEVGAEGYGLWWRGGSPFAHLLAANFAQVREAILGAGAITAEELAADLARLRDPATLLPAPIMWTVWGRRPEA